MEDIAEPRTVATMRPRSFPLPAASAARSMTPSPSGVVAYVSMEIGIDPAFPTYSGGLGILAGDTVRSAADLGVSAVAITLAHRDGYFRQTLDAEGRQSEEPDPWRPEDHLERLETVVTIELGGRLVRIGAFRYDVRGVTGAVVPIYFLDTDHPDNDDDDRTLTGRLYAGDDFHRLKQEVVLGVGGVALLDALGVEVRCWHMNEGHAALLALALLRTHTGPRGVAAATEEDFAKVRERCVFTTHTPVPAGHDRFVRDLAVSIIGPKSYDALATAGGTAEGGALDMTRIALASSRYVNGVSARHGEVSREMFPDRRIDAITNGVHAATWIAPPMAAVLDRHVEGWRRDAAHLRTVVRVPAEEIADAHTASKRILLDEVERVSGLAIDPASLVLGFARRATPYKRADMLVSDLERLRAIAGKHGPLAVVYAGKAHPADGGGKELIRRIHAASAELGAEVPVVYLPNYRFELAAKLVAGVDVWVNTPRPPLEASGTSGMKAALNGVPSLSTLDGWWIEGHVEGVTGWSVDGDGEDEAAQAASLYDKLERSILPAFRDRAAWAEIQRSSIALNGSWFNTQRMVEQYIANAWLPRISL